MGYFQAVVLGVVQGLTEFLPVSSSAHLILARALLGWDAAELGLAFDVACHVGTLGAVVAYFRADIAALTLAAPGLFRAPVWPADAAGRRLRLIAVGTVPVVIVGVLLAGAIEDTLRTPWVTVVTLAAVAVLFLARGTERPGDARRGGCHAGRGAGDRRGAGRRAGAGRVAVGRDDHGRDVSRASGVRPRRGSRSCSACPPSSRRRRTRACTWPGRA